MTRKLWRNVAWSVPVAGIALLGVVNCGGGMPGLPGGLGDKIPGGIPGSCKLDTTSIDAIESFDFSGEFGLKADVAAKLKAATVAAAALNELKAKVDADLIEGCGGLAKDLGAGGDFKTGEEACTAALTIVNDTVAKMKGTIDIAYEAPHCGVDINAHADCSGKCEVQATGGQVKIECEKGHLQGECSAQCTGSCEISGSAKCEGTCNGGCDAKFTGTCGGTCDGNCDGKKSTGACAGKCEGKCDAHGSGSCGGSCSGGCKLSGSASCNGTCSGECSVEMKAPKCTAEATPPKMSAECKAKCDARVEAKAECTPGHVALVVKGAADAALATKFRTAVSTNLPKVLKIALGMRKQLEGTAAGVKDAVMGIKAVAEESAKAGGANGAMMAAKITGCVGGAFDGAAKAAGALSGSVSVSVKVSASASGKASM